MALKILISENIYKKIICENENEQIENIMRMLFNSGFPQLAIELIKSQNLDINELTVEMLKQQYNIVSIEDFSKMIEDVLNSPVGSKWINPISSVLEESLSIRIGSQYKTLNIVFSIKLVDGKAKYDEISIPYSEYSEKLPEAYNKLFGNAKEFLVSLIYSDKDN